jgi:hypothetical protein
MTEGSSVNSLGKTSLVQDDTENKQWGADRAISEARMRRSDA